MAKQMNQLPRELKQLDVKEIDPSLLYIRELRGRSVNEDSGMPPIKQPSPGPTHVQSLKDNPTPIVDGLPSPVYQGTPVASSSIQTQSSSDMDTDQGDMIEEFIKQVTHKLYQTILTPDVGTSNSACATNSGTSKASITTRVSNSLTPKVTNNTSKDSSTACQVPKHSSLDPLNTNPYKNAACTEINCPQT